MILPCRASRRPVNTDTISGIIGAFCEKRRRMQVFFSLMVTALRSSFSLIVVLVLHTNSVHLLRKFYRQRFEWREIAVTKLG